MKNKLLFASLLSAMMLNSQNTLTGVGDNFEDGTLATSWHGNGHFELFENKNKLQVNFKELNEKDCFYWDLAPGVDVSSSSKLKFKLKTGVPLNVSLEFIDKAGASTGEIKVSHEGDLRTKEVEADLASGKKIDFKKLVKVKFRAYPKVATVDGIIYFDEFSIGTSGPNNGDTSPFPLSADIRMNQLGFYPNGQKFAVIKDPVVGQFKIAKANDLQVVFTGDIGVASKWEYSDENVSVIDFTKFEKEGEYVIIVEGKGRSFPFKIKKQINLELAKASVKMYYFQRSGMPLEPKYAGVWARPTGHPDNDVMIHPSAASTGRPSGSIIRSSRGWYDAGDYGKYVVNSGISTYTLLSLYEQFPKMYDTLKLNIPESGNKIPDLLDECLWNIRWMLTMQDPTDGGVYHKVTANNFEGMELPHLHTAQRLAIGKGTAATCDFAAVMAQSSRIFKTFEKELPGLSDSCIKAAEKAWLWASKNNNVPFVNPSDVVTGEYGDGSVVDELEWAAQELYITTKKIEYAKIAPLANSYSVPSWPQVNTLGLYSLYNYRKAISAAYDTTQIKSAILKLADEITVEANSKSQYKVPIGTFADFVWGSNSVCGNEVITLLNAFRITQKPAYLNAAISGLDYLLGRNATNYSFVTGFGSKPAMHPHHRPSAGDKIVDPVPGMLVGGPQNTNNPESCVFDSQLPATKYKDDWCSYSTNEIAINWNAPLAFIAGAIEAYMKK